jgi:hypothetical protein
VSVGSDGWGYGQASSYAGSALPGNLVINNGVGGVSTDTLETIEGETSKDTGMLLLVFSSCDAPCLKTKVLRTSVVSLHVNAPRVLLHQAMMIWSGLIQLLGDVAMIQLLSK